jgi:aspartyl-tRNA(Asn)/glutamyl-tRNA(Gln) amidotransferase subunit B
MAKFESVIGLETHIQLNTKAKIFCRCKADSWGDPPNVNICPVCTGLPGVLPTLNRAVLEKAVLLANAMHMQSIQSESYFARKNYFYPDLPKGYQISQYDEPLARDGYFDVAMPDGKVCRVTIQKLHVEEDAGKTIHDGGERLIDFNRCGVPLVEMVTGPDLRSADEGAQFLIRLRQLLRWLGISEGDMERGQLRCDANVSIRPMGSDELRTKTEIKNVNSIENLRTAIQAEVDRQTRQVREGQDIEAWTLDWDEDREILRKMRSKETEADYRYFREPDLLPVSLDEGWLSKVRASLPELPNERRQRFRDEYHLPLYDAEILTEERSLSDYFEKTVGLFDGEPKVVSNWMMNDVLRLIRERGTLAGRLNLRPSHLAEIIRMVENNRITSSTGKELLEKVEDTRQDPASIVAEEGLTQVSDEGTLRDLAAGIIQDNPGQVSTYLDGKTTIIGWFVGQIMRETKGKANPQLARTILEELLSAEEG